MDKLSTDGNKAKDSVIIFDGKDPNRAGPSMIAILTCTGWYH